MFIYQTQHYDPSTNLQSIFTSFMNNHHHKVHDPVWILPESGVWTDADVCNLISAPHKLRAFSIPGLAALTISLFIGGITTKNVIKVPWVLTPWGKSTQNLERDRLWCGCNRFGLLRTWSLSTHLGPWPWNLPHGRGPMTPDYPNNTVIQNSDRPMLRVGILQVWCPSHGYARHYKFDGQISSRSDQVGFWRRGCMFLLGIWSPAPHKLQTTIFVQGMPLSGIEIPQWECDSNTVDPQSQ